MWYVFGFVFSFWVFLAPLQKHLSMLVRKELVNWDTLKKQNISVVP